MHMRQFAFSCSRRACREHFEKHQCDYSQHQLWISLGDSNASNPTPMGSRRFFGAIVFGLVVIPCVQSQNPPATAAQPTGAQSTTAAAARENYDPLLDLPPLPHNTVTLIGGSVVRVDEIMNRMVVQPFGSKQKLNVAFDMRTHIFRDGQPITEREIKPGERIYLDTMLNGSKVFAKQIWIQTSLESGVGQGQIISFDSRRAVLTVRDELSSQPLKMHLTPATVIQKGDQSASPADLVEGSLVALSFGPQRQLERIKIVATPGTVFTFAGRVTYLDMSRRMIALDNRTDRKKYDIYVDTIAPNLLKQIREGEDVDVSAVFDGNRYDARSVTPAHSTSAQQP
jgi:hypothetical protein